MFRTTSRTAYSGSEATQPRHDSLNHSTSSHLRNHQLPSPVSPSTQQFSPFPFPPPATASTSQEPEPTSRQSQLLPIKGFVHEVLRRSRTSAGVLQTALCYLQAVRMKVPDLVRKQSQCDGTELSPDEIAESRITIGDPNELFPESESASWSESDSVPTVRLDDEEVLPLAPQTQSMSLSPSDDTHLPVSLTAAQPSVPLPSPLLCPRRTFLACLILASKFMQDRSYSNRAWAKLAGLPPREIGRCERALGNLLEWRLWVGKGPSPPSKASQGNRTVTRSRSDGDVLYGNPRAAAMQPPAQVATPRHRSGLQRSSTLPNLTTNSYAASPSTTYWVNEHLSGLLEPDVSFTAEPLSQTPQTFEPFLSPPLATPPLSSSPSASSASSDEGERTIQMSTTMDIPSSFPPSATLKSRYDVGSFGGSSGILFTEGPQPYIRGGVGHMSSGYIPSPLSSSPYRESGGPNLTSHWTLAPI